MRFTAISILGVLLSACAVNYDYMEPAAPANEPLVLSQDSVTVYFLQPEGGFSFWTSRHDNGPMVIDLYAHNQPIGYVGPNSYMRARLPLAQDGTVLLSGKFWDFANLRLTAKPGSTHYIRLICDNIQPPRLILRMLGPIKGPEILKRCKREAPMMRLANPVSVT